MTPSGTDGLIDEPRSGRPREVDRSKIIAVTLTPPPKKLGITHWSSRLLASFIETVRAIQSLKLFNRESEREGQWLNRYAES